MTDHSILRPGLPDFPFRKEAQLLDRVFKFVANMHLVLHTAIDMHNLVNILKTLNDDQLAEIGIERSDIAAYAATKAGLLG